MKKIYIKLLRSFFQVEVLIQLPANLLKSMMKEVNLAAPKPGATSGTGIKM